MIITLYFTVIFVGILILGIFKDEIAALDKEDGDGDAMYILGLIFWPLFLVAILVILPFILVFELGRVLRKVVISKERK